MSVEEEFKQLLHTEIASQSLARNLSKERKKGQAERQRDRQKQKQKATQYRARFDEIILEEAEYWDSLATIHFFMKYHLLDLNPEVTSKKRIKAWQLHAESVAQGKGRSIPTEDKQRLQSIVEWIKLDSGDVVRSLSEKSQREKRDYLLELVNKKTDNGSLLTKHYPRNLGGESNLKSSVLDTTLGVAVIAVVILVLGGIVSGKVHWIVALVLVGLLTAAIIYGRRRR